MRGVKGFTLVELSIVLIIIGLIIGGVLSGQALLASAEVNATVSDFNKYKTAYNAFLLKYDEKPGDFNQAAAYWTVAQAENGDGDGRIEAAFTAPAVNTEVESYQAWRHLAEAGIITSTSDANGAALAGGDIAVAADWATAGDIAQSFFHFQFFTIHGKPTNYLNLTGVGLVQNTNGDGFDGLTVRQAFQIDTKLDDGVARTGALRALNSTADDPTANEATDCLTNLNANAASIYRKSTTQVACTLHYAMD